MAQVLVINERTKENNNNLGDVVAIYEDQLRNSTILEEAAARPYRVSAALRLRYAVHSCLKLSGSLNRRTSHIDFNGVI